MSSVVILNHWGGVPRVLHDTVCSSQGSWVSEVVCPLLLTHYDPGNAFGRFLGGVDDDGRICPQRSWLHRFRRQGYKVVVLGPTGLSPSSVTVTEEPCLQDPEASLRDWGVDLCSIETEERRGRSIVHDRAVLCHARRVLASTDRVFMIVNLLSCRDLNRLRVAPTSMTHVDVATLRKSSTTPFHTEDDPRLIPRCLLSTSLGSLGETLAFADARRHGERRVHNDPSSYTSLVQAGHECVSALQNEIDEFTLSVLARKDTVRIATTATHSMSIGEHGVRGGGAPSHVCSYTFWCASWVSGRPLLPFHTVDDWVLGSLDIPSQEETPPAATFGYLPDGTLYARTVCTVHERHFVCVCVWERASDTPRLVAVFDDDADPEETENILDNIVHLHQEFVFPIRLPPLVPRQNSRDNSLFRRSDPPHTKSEVPGGGKVATKSEAPGGGEVPIVSASPRDVTPPPPHHRPVRRGASFQRSSPLRARSVASIANLRQKESRLNKMHR